MEYSIGEFSKLTGLGIHTLRYYEQEGLIAPERNSGNRRGYYDKDLTWIEFIKRLKDTGMPIKEIKHYAELRAAGDSTLSERMECWCSTDRRLMSRLQCYRNIKLNWMRR